MAWRHGQAADCNRRNCHRYSHFLGVYGDFWLNSSFEYSFQWVAHILQYVGRTESTCKCQHKARELAVNTAKGISSPTLYGASTRIWLLHLALWDAWRSCLTEAVNFCRPGDLLWIGRRVTGGADVPYKRICAATLKVEDHSFVS